MKADFASASWFKSSKSGNIDCVEVAFAGTQIGVRDSKDSTGRHLTFPAGAWGAFTSGIARGDFDKA